MPLRRQSVVFALIHNTHARRDDYCKRLFLFPPQIPHLVPRIFLVCNIAYQLYPWDVYSQLVIFSFTLSAMCFVFLVPSSCAFCLISSSILSSIFPYALPTHHQNFVIYILCYQYFILFCSANVASCCLVVYILN